MQASQAQTISKENQQKMKKHYFDYLVSEIKQQSAQGKYGFTTTHIPEGLGNTSKQEVIQELVDLGYTILTYTDFKLNQIIISWYPRDSFDLSTLGRYQKVYTNIPTYRSQPVKTIEEKPKNKLEKFIEWFRK